MRWLYRLLLKMHPKPFRERFGPEMLCIFEDGLKAEGKRRLIVDGFTSLLRQWVFRSRGKRPAVEGSGVASELFASLAQRHQSFHSQMACLIFGGVISLALFAVSGALLGRGNAHHQIGWQIYRGEAKLDQALVPSDLMSVSDECAPGLKPGCSAEAYGTGASVLPEALSRPYELPYPSGRFGIGQVSYGFAEPSSEPTGSSELKLSIWYPAEIDPNTTVPVQNVWDFSKATGKFVETHTVENAKIAAGSIHFPVILFRPATGNSSAAYLSQIENLVSHGYIVAGVEANEPVMNAEFQDTRLTVFESDMRRAFFVPANRQPSAVLSRAEALQHGRESTAADELHLAFNQIILLASGTSKDTPFAGRIDLEHVGAFGHGSGGNAVARFCEADPRISACLDEDGWTPQGPLPRGELASLDQPFLWIDVRLEPPDLAELTYAHMTREQFSQLANESERAAESELSSLHKGAYRITLLAPGVSDRNFTDGPMVWSMSPRGRADSQARTALALTNIYTRMFFDKYLKNKSAALLNSDTELPLRNVRVRRYPPKR